MNENPFADLESFERLRAEALAQAQREQRNAYVRRWQNKKYANDSAYAAAKKRTSAARYRALQRLRRAHLEEFAGYLHEEMAKDRQP